MTQLAALGGPDTVEAAAAVLAPLLIEELSKS
jgi:hypothetical protein